MAAILVTGSCGYIGSHVVRRLCEEHVDVIALDVMPEPADFPCRYVSADILDSSLDLASVLPEVPEACLHLAWRNGFDHTAESHFLDLSSHYRFLMSLVSAGISRIAVMGTMHEVGYWEGAVTDDTPCNPLSPYGIAKDSLRRVLSLRASRGDFELQWLRAFYIYGDDERSQSIFGKLLRADREGQKLFPFTSGKNRFDFIEVRELARLIAAAVTQSSVDGIINICTGVPQSLAEKVEGYISEHNLGIELDYGAYPDRPYDSPGIWGDPTKIRRILSERR